MVSTDVFTLDDFGAIGVMAVSYVGVLWLTVSSLISCCKGKSSAPAGKTEPVAPPITSPDSMKVENLIMDVENAGRPAAEPLVAITEPSLAPAAPVAPAKPRMYFLDNLKAFLTVVVICHHTIDAFRGSPSTGVAFCVTDPATLQPPAKTVYTLFAGDVTTLNQSYFMALFFFISAYFTPSSLDRKGVAGFLRDRFKRIGIPAIIYNNGLGPFQMWLIMAIGRNDPDVSFPGVGYLNRTYWYSPYPGQCWFLFWLLVLSFIYAFVHRLPVTMPSPQLTHVCLFAFGVGIWFILKPYGDGMGDFAMMPGGIHSFFYYILYFSAGILAKRNDWMVEIMKMHTKGRAIFLWGLTIFLALSVTVYKYSTSSLFQSDADVKTAEQSSDMYHFCLGFFAVIISLGELLLFNAYFNSGGRVSKFFCESAYGAYILHFLFLELGINIYFRMMRQFSGIPAENFVFWQALLPYQGTSHVVWTNVNGVTVSEGWTWFGMLFVCTFATLCSFVSAFFLRKLPLFNQVL